MAEKKFEPEKIVDLNVDWYGILGLIKGCLPPYGRREDNQQIAKILEQAWRRSARKAHPDSGGSDEAFKLVVRAHTILSNPLYRRYLDSDGMDRARQVGESNVDVDWSTVGTYEPHTTADVVGFSLFNRLNELIKDQDLPLIPAFRPSLPHHAYEWDWRVKDKEDAKLALAIVYDADDVLRLTSGDDIEESLPFKIYLCFPRASIEVFRGEETPVYSDKGEHMGNLPGQFTQCVYSDLELLETTKIQEAEDYLTALGSISDDIQKFLDGTLESKKREEAIASGQHDWIDKEKIQKFDVNALKNVLRRKTFVLKPDPRAADFLSRFPGADKTKE